MAVTMDTTPNRGYPIPNADPQDLVPQLRAMILAVDTDVDSVSAGGGTGTVTNTGTLTDHAVIVGNGTTDVSALASLGTTTTVLHGNAAGDPTWGAVALASDVSGQLPLANGGTGANLSDPGANKLLGWDDTDNAIAFFAVGSGLSYDHATHTLSGSNQTITLSGDVSGSGATSITTTLASVNPNVGVFGSATQTPQFTVNAKGLITGVSNVTLTPALGSITGLGTNVATFLATPSSANLAAAVTGETGSGALVFATSPALVTPDIGVATGNQLTLSGTYPTDGYLKVGDYEAAFAYNGTSGLAANVGFISRDNRNSYAGYFEAHDSSNTGTTAYVIGLVGVGRTHADSAATLTRVVGVEGYAVIHNSPETTRAYGVLSIVSVDNSTLSTRVVGVECEVSCANANTIPLVVGFRNTQDVTVGTVTALRGLDLSNWTVSAGGAVTTSYGIYMDTSIDVGTTKYAIYSLSTSPSLLTGGLTLGGNLTPSTNDGAALGTTALMFSDLHLASGAVVNFNNGDVTLTHSSDKITVAGGTLAVPDDAYDASTWNGSTDVPTKNAVRDKIESILTSSGFATVNLNNLSSVAINASLLPAVSDAVALGSPTKMWSDLFLASTGIINWNNGGITIAETADSLVFAGASAGYYLNDGKLIIVGDGTATGVINAGNAYSAGSAWMGINAGVDGAGNSDVIGGGFSAGDVSTTGTTTIVVGVNAVGRSHANSGTISFLYGVFGTSEVHNAPSVGKAYGLRSTVSVDNSTVTDSVGGVRAVLTLANTNTIPAARVFRGEVSVTTGTVTDLRGLDLSGWTASSTVTTSYGIYMDTSIDVGTTKYAIYSLSASPSLLSGNLTISNTAPSLVLTDTTASAKSLTIAVDANVANFRESAGAAGSLMVLDLANNSVGIGTSAPTTNLTVSANPTAPNAPSSGAVVMVVGANGSNSAMLFDAFGGAGAFHFRRSDGTNASKTAVSSGAILGSVVALGYDGSGYTSTAKIFMELTTLETWSGSAQGCRFGFNTTALGTTTRALRMVIEENTKIGGTARRATTEGAGHLDLFNGTDPAGALTNGVSLFSSSGKLKSADAAGTIGHVLAVSAVNTVSPTAQNRTLTVDIGGTTYYITAKTTND